MNEKEIAYINEKNIEYEYEENEEKSTEDLELEAKFKEVSEVVSKKIREKIAAASQLLLEAVSLSDKNGVPFYSEVSFMGDSYVPRSLDTKFPGIDDDVVSDITGVFPEGDFGWQTSHC